MCSRGRTGWGRFKGKGRMREAIHEVVVMVGDVL
jgi:hypothetical protein